MAIAAVSPLAADLEHVLAYTEAVWPRLRGARLFITGGTGFFGTWLLESLVYANNRHRLGIRATVLSRNPDAFLCRMPHLAETTALDWVRGDVLDFRFPSGSFSHVIHAATEASGKLNEERPLAMFDTIVGGTRRVLDFAVASGAKDFLLISSGAVYGRQPPDLSHVPEDYPGSPDLASPLSAYGEGKRAAELLCAIYHHHHGIVPKIARCFAFVGPHLPLDAHFAIGNFIRDALEGRQIVVCGDGRPYRSYLYTADLAVWLWTILVHGRANRTYNVGSGEAINIRNLANLAASLAPPTSVKVLQTAGEGLPARYVPNVVRAEHELGLSSRIPLSEAIERTFRWLLREKQA